MVYSFTTATVVTYTVSATAAPSIGTTFAGAARVVIATGTYDNLISASAHVIHMLTLEGDSCTNWGGQYWFAAVNPVLCVGGPP